MQWVMFAQACYQFQHTFSQSSDEQRPNANTPVNFSIPDLSTSFLSNLGVFCSALSLTEVSGVRANHDEMSVCRARFTLPLGCFFDWGECCSCAWGSPPVVWSVFLSI